MDMLENFPNEILALILARIACPERNTLRQVCKRWAQLLDDEVGIELRIGHPSVFDPRHIKDANISLVYHPYSVLSRVGVYNLVVGKFLESDKETPCGWVDKVLNMFRKPDEVKAFRSPAILNELHFCSPILPEFFTTLITVPPFIKSLTLHVSSLSRLGSEHLREIDLPWLEMVLVKLGRNVTDFTEMQYVDIKEWNNEEIHRRVLDLCSNHFPKLKEATIESLYDFDLGMETVRTFVHFLHLHRKSLRVFELTFGLLIHEQFVQIHEPINVGETDLLAYEMNLKLTSKLRKINIMSMCLAILPYANVWTHLIQLQRELEVLILTGILIKEEFVQKIVDFNFSTLKSICISRIHLFDSQGPMQFNCRVFNPCDSLKCLTLRGWTVTMAVNALTNVKQLPNSLTEIDFGDLAITKEDVRFLALELPCLTNLELYHIGHAREMGMDISTFQEVINRKQLKELRLLRSLSQAIQEIGIFNGDEDQPEYFKETHKGFIGITLGTRGFYTAIKVTDKLF